MAKDKVSAHQRAREFRTEGLIATSTQKLWCNFCGEEVKHDKKSIVQKHTISGKHAKNKAHHALQPGIQDVVCQAEGQFKVWKEMIAAFVCAEISLYAFRKDKFRTWMKSNLKCGDNLPSESSLRRIMKINGEDDLSQTKELCLNRNIIVMTDETMDIKNRKVVNVLVAPTVYGIGFRLALTKIVENCNAGSILQTVFEAVRNLDIPVHRIKCLISDNANYMVSAGKTSKEMNKNKFIHSTCWAHVLHLLSEEIRLKMKLADKCIAMVKSATCKANSRRQQLLDALEECGLPRILPPVPVITRWTTWLAAGAYLATNWAGICSWIEKSEEDAVSISILKKLIKKESLLIELNKIQQVYPGISYAIKTLEGKCVISSDVWLILNTVDHLVNDVLQISSQKLQLYMTSKHPAKTFWKDAEYCDARKVSSMFDEKDLWKLPESLTIFSSSPIPEEEITKYKCIVEKGGFPATFSPSSFWIQYSREMPILSTASLAILSVPASSADVERSLSSLNRILRPVRNSFTEENLGIHLRLQFNNNAFGALYDDGEEEEGDNE